MPCGDVQGAVNMDGVHDLLLKLGDLTRRMSCWRGVCRRRSR